MIATMDRPHSTVARMKTFLTNVNLIMMETINEPKNCPK